MSPAPRAALVLVPTPLELRHLAALPPLPGADSAPRLCGFGPVAAAARTAQLLAEQRPARVLLVGIAGSLDPALAPGSAREFARVRLDGLGAGSGAGFLPPSRLGFAQWQDERGAVEDELALAAGGAGELLTVCAAAATPAEAEARRRRYPHALAEEMEAFGVALACRLAGVPLGVVRGFSNRAGERDPARWCVGEALRAAHLLAVAWLTRPGEAPR